jgi:hypothetical protein
MQNIEVLLHRDVSVLRGVLQAPGALGLLAGVGLAAARMSLWRSVQPLPHTPAFAVNMVVVKWWW